MQPKIIKSRGFFLLSNNYICCQQIEMSGFVLHNPERSLAFDNAEKLSVPAR